jgi:hypothetical protein
MKHLGSSLRNPLKYTKQNYIKTNTTLETLQHNFDNYEHDGIGWLVKVVTCFISLKVNTITCVIWGQKPNRLLTKESSRTSETRYHRRTNNWQGHTRTKKTASYTNLYEVLSLQIIHMN